MVEKAGKLIIVTSLCATYLQFRYEVEYQGRLEDWSKEFLDRCAERGFSDIEARKNLADRKAELGRQFENNRRRVFLNAIVLAAFGELLAAFGGDLFAIGSNWIA
jgi:hypothetical protein